MALNESRELMPPLDAPRLLVRGTANAGKTTLALGRVAALVEAGAPAASVLLVCASATAVADARRTLDSRAGGDCLAGVRVATARDVELELLAAPAARAHTGRRARVLTDFEETFLLEDLRVTGLPARRLKGMLGFFRKSWTELADDDMASFIIDAREQMVIDAVRGHLAAYDAMLACEVSNLCVSYLRACPEATSGLGVSHIVIDDYQCLNRASQVALDMLGTRTLTAFADSRHAAQGADPFPYPAGIGEFLERNAGAAVVDLPDASPQDACGAAAALASSGYLDALSLGLLESGGKVEIEQAYDVTPLAVAPAGVRRVTCETPQEEFAEVANQVRDLLVRDAHPTEVLVLAPNRSWLANVGRALDAEGVAHQELSDRQAVGGSFRDLGRCAAGRFYATLALLADPSDPLAWRVLCGCGDYLARSAAFAGIEKLARERGVSLDEAIALLADGDAPAVPGQGGVIEAWHKGRALIGALEGLHGEALLDGLARELGLGDVPQAFAELVRGDEPDAAELFERAYRAVLAPALDGDEAGVRLATYDAACGLKAPHVIVCGLMNGWTPPHAYFDLAEAGFAERQAMDAAARRELYALSSRATQTLTLTGFASCDLELAERLGLKGYRVRMGADGRRVTACRPSDLGTYALHAWGLADIPARGLLVEAPAPSAIPAHAASVAACASLR